MAIDKAQLKAFLQSNPDDPLWDGLVGAWFIDEGVGLTVADSYGSNDGTIVLQNNNTSGWTADGYSIHQTAGATGASKIQLSSDPLDGLSGSFTKLARTKWDPSKFINWLVGYSGQSQTLGRLYVNAVDPDLVKFSVAGVDLEVANAGDFMDIIIRTDGTTTEMLVDGTVVATGSAVEQSSLYLAYAAANSSGGASHIEVSLDLLWNRYLDDDEIDDIINNNYSSSTGNFFIMFER